MQIKRIQLHRPQKAQFMLPSLGGDNLLPRLFRDPRHWQVTMLLFLLIGGTVTHRIDVTGAAAVTLVGSALATQWLFSRWLGIGFDPRSPLISGLSLCLLARAAGPWSLAATAVISIASKFLLRSRGKHVWNPTNLGLVVMSLATGAVWVSPGQWGSGLWLLLLFGGLGMLVTYRASRSDVTWAFLGFWSLVVFGRALWLGDPLAIPIHALQSGSILIFAFLMISDPKTTPDTRMGRVAFAGVVALVAGVIQFKFYQPAAPLLALAFCAPLVPLFDRLLPGERYSWRGTGFTGPSQRSAFSPPANPQLQPGAHIMSKSKRNLRARGRRKLTASVVLLLAFLVVFAMAAPASAFCGFYVARADADLWNEASQVVIARDGDRTVLTMGSDYQGEPSEFAMVIPVPTLLERDQIHVAEQALIDHLDQYTSPRLVEYHDENPCDRRRLEQFMRSAAAPPEGAAQEVREADGVTIEARYTVGEYDILLLSAEQSDGLLKWLQRNDYRVPRGADRVLGSYIRQGMHFFVAKVNLEEQSRLGTSLLRPLQIAFESPKFMLPIRLGTLNAKGAQDLLIYTLTRRGRVETTNYRTVRMPTGSEIPTFVKDEFGDFYRDMFSHQVRAERQRAVFLEYAWDMAWCDPCAADPLSASQLRELGVFWLDDNGRNGDVRRRRPGNGAQNVFVTRLHVRYDRETFPEDLRFQETSDRTNFQGRYVMRHPYTGPITCQAGKAYQANLQTRFEREAQTLANLTGWDREEIRARQRHTGLAVTTDPAPEKEAWWRRLWPGN